MPRFEIGSRVRIAGSIAEHYSRVTAVVVWVRLHPQGLPHLNQYRVLISENGEETFYEFQLARVREEQIADSA